MDKQEHSQKIDALVVECALTGCNKDKLEQLVIKYAIDFRCPHQISAERVRSLKTDAEREAVEHMEDNVNEIIMTTLKDMTKSKKQLYSQKIDELVVGCALGTGCDEAELVRLAIDYAHDVGSPYALASVHLQMMESREERAAATQMEAKVNKVITKTIQRERPMGAMSRVVMKRFSMQPGPIPQTIMHPCKCKGPKQSPQCRMLPALCKTATHSLSRTVPREKAASPKTKAASPKTKAASPKTKSASPKTKAASPKTKKSPPKYGGRNKSKRSRK